MGLLLLRSKVDVLDVSVISFEKRVSARGSESFQAVGNLSDARSFDINICQFRELLDQEGFWTAVDLHDLACDPPVYLSVPGQHIARLSTRVSVYLSWSCDLFVLQCNKLKEGEAVQEMARILQWLDGCVRAVKMILDGRRTRED
jgi:hypothetical protein